jgi:6-pyruvoyl-tetrahydropterin synthase
MRLFNIIAFASFALITCNLSAASLFGVASMSHLTKANILQLRGGDGDTPQFRPYLPHTLAIRDSLMIAHSFHGHPSFGPAGGMHGATYTVDVEFASTKLHSECNWVIDIGLASDLVADVLKEYNYKNLDEVFGDNVMTTTEFMCQVIHKGVAKKLKERSSKNPAEETFEGWIKVTLWESHKAWGSYEGPLL